MNSKQVRSVLCGLSPEEQDILQDEYGISARVSDVGLDVTEDMKTHAVEWLYGIPSVYTLTNRPDEFRCLLLRSPITRKRKESSLKRKLH